LSTSEETNLLCLQDFTELLPQESFQAYPTLLSSEDLQRVQNIQTSYEQRIELGQLDIIIKLDQYCI